MTTWGCHYGGMAEQTKDHQDTFDRLRQVRAEAIEHTKKALDRASERLTREEDRAAREQAEIDRERERPDVR